MRYQSVASEIFSILKPLLQAITSAALRLVHELIASKILTLSVKGSMSTYISFFF